MMLLTIEAWKDFYTPFLESNKLPYDHLSKLINLRFLFAERRTRGHALNSRCHTCNS